MAEYKSQKTGPGAVIFLALVALIFIWMAVGKFGGFDINSSYPFLHRTQSRELTLYFDSVSGIKERSPVAYAGRKCGEVKTIRILKPAESKADETGKHYYVEVKTNVEAETPVNSDTKVMIMMVGMLGDKQVDLTPGDPNAKPLGAGQPLFGDNAGLEKLTATARKLTVKLEHMMDNVDGLLTQVNGIVKDPQFQENLKATIANARKTLSKAEETLAQAKEMLGENRDNIKGVLGNARELTGTAKGTVARLNGTLDDVRPRLKGTLENTQKLTGDLKPKVTALLDKAGDALGKAGGTLDKAKEMLSENKENIGGMLTNGRETLNNTKHLTHTMRAIFAPWTLWGKEKAKTTNGTVRVVAPVAPAVDAPYNTKKELIAPAHPQSSAPVGGSSSANYSTKPSTPQPAK